MGEKLPYLLTSLHQRKMRIFEEIFIQKRSLVCLSISSIVATAFLLLPCLPALPGVRDKNPPFWIVFCYLKRATFFQDFSLGICKIKYETRRARDTSLAFF